MSASVTPIGNRLYRGLGNPPGCRMPFGATADCQSALQQIANRRYSRLPIGCHSAIQQIDNLRYANVLLN
jgi:hypothetical protein